MSWLQVCILFPASLKLQTSFYVHYAPDVLLLQTCCSKDCVTNLMVNAAEQSYLLGWHSTNEMFTGFWLVKHWLFSRQKKANKVSVYQISTALRGSNFLRYFQLESCPLPRLHSIMTVLWSSFLKPRNKRSAMFTLPFRCSAEKQRHTGVSWKECIPVSHLWRHNAPLCDRYLRNHHGDDKRMQIFAPLQ